MGGGGRGGGSGSSRGGRDKVKPKRGGPRHFTVHPRDLYMKEGRPEESGEESGSQDESGSEEELVQRVAAVSIGCNDGQEDDESSNSESSEEEDEKIKSSGTTRGRPLENPNRQNKPIPSDKPLSLDALCKKPAHELTRREREAIEKERARQHFLKMKEKEDAARLALVKKQREEAAAKAAAEKQAKEDARLRKR
jgi:hypothetical protein